VEGRWQPPTTYLPKLDPAFESIITRAMRLKPDDRYPTVFELGKALFPFASAKVQPLYADYYTRPAAPLSLPKLEAIPQRSDQPILPPATAVLPDLAVPDWQRQATRTSLPPAHDRGGSGMLPSAFLAIPGSEGPSSPQFVARQSRRRLMLMMGIGAVAVLISLALVLYLMRMPKDGRARETLSRIQSAAPGAIAPTQTEPAKDSPPASAKAALHPDTPPSVVPAAGESPKNESLDVESADSVKDSAKGKVKSRKRFTPSGHPIL